MLYDEDGSPSVEKGKSLERNRKFSKLRMRRVSGKLRNGIETVGKLGGGKLESRETKNREMEQVVRRRLRLCYLISKVRFLQS